MLKWILIPIAIYYAFFAPAIFMDSIMANEPLSPLPVCETTQGAVIAAHGVASHWHFHADGVEHVHAHSQHPHLHDEPPPVQEQPRSAFFGDRGRLLWGEETGAGVWNAWSGADGW